MSRSRATGPSLLLLLSLAAGCGSSPAADTSEGGDRGRGSAGTADLAGELTVLAAASLTETFAELARRFESEHPQATVRLAFDSSATLAEQVAQGAPADVLATADERTMAGVVDAGLTAGAPEVFATNRPVLAVPPEDPAGIEEITDLDADAVDYVVCVDSAPCGVLARTVLSEAGVEHPPASEEVDVKAVLSKVTLGEADAGIVYASDLVAAGDAVRRVGLPETASTLTRYPVAALAEAAEPDLAAAWVDLVASSAGSDVLLEAGFGTP